LSAIQVINYIHTYHAKISKTNDHQTVHMLSSDASVQKANISSLEARQKVSPQVCTCSSHCMALTVPLKQHQLKLASNTVSQTWFTQPHLDKVHVFSL